MGESKAGSYMSDDDDDFDYFLERVETERQIPVPSSYDNPGMLEMSSNPVMSQIQAQIRSDFAPILKQIQRQNVRLLNKDVRPVLSRRGMNVRFKASETAVLQMLTEIKQEIVASNARIVTLDARSLTMEAAIQNIAAQNQNTDQSMLNLAQAVNNRSWMQTVDDSGLEGLLDSFISNIIDAYSPLGKKDPTYKHLVFAKNTILLAVSPLTSVLKVVQGQPTNFGEIVWNFILSWTESTLGALKDLLTQTVGLGGAAFKFFVSGLNLGQAINNFSDLIKKFLYYTISMAVIMTQFDFLILFVTGFDVICKSSYAPYLETLKIEINKFMWNMISDGFMLPFRVVEYLVAGTDELTGEESVKEVLLGDKKLWFVAKFFLSRMRVLFQPLIDSIQKSPVMKNNVKRAKWVGKQIREGWRMYNFYKEEFQKMMAQLYKEAMAALYKVYDRSREISDTAAASFEKAKADLSSLVKIGQRKIGDAKEAAGAFLRQFFPGAPALAAPPAKLHNLLTVCNLLNISENAFSRLKNQKLVKYVQKNNLNDYELLYVLHSTMQETTPQLRF